MVHKCPQSTCDGFPYFCNGNIIASLFAQPKIPSVSKFDETYIIFTWSLAFNLFMDYYRYPILFLKPINNCRASHPRALGHPAVCDLNGIPVAADLLNNAHQ